MIQKKIRKALKRLMGDDVYHDFIDDILAENKTVPSCEIRDVVYQPQVCLLVNEHYIYELPKIVKDYINKGGNLSNLGTTIAECAKLHLQAHYKREGEEKTQ